MVNIIRPRTLTSMGLFAALAVIAGPSVAQEASGTGFFLPPLPPSGFVTASRPYVVPVSPEYSVQPLLSAGDRLPRTGAPGQQYQMVGIPDGMGAYQDRGNTVIYMNHELGSPAVTSEPIIGAPLNRGTIVSRLVMARDGTLLSGNRAYDLVFDNETLVGNAPDATNTTPGFARFCSGSLSYKEAGFDRPIYFAGEESSGAATFDGKGGLTVAIFEEDGVGELHTMPQFGRFPWENTLAQPKRQNKTVLIGMEDGPNTPDNQLYMFVGTKSRSPSASPMARNGLDSGTMYVFVSDTPGVNDEAALFAAGSMTGHWVAIPQPQLLTDVQLEAAADAVGAFGFVRTEDGAFNPQDPDEYYFVTTGSGTTNELGAMYRMKLNRSNAASSAPGSTKIDLIFNANAVVAAGGDTALSPDNIGIDRNYILINEDGTAQSRAAMTAKGRDGSVWRLNKATLQATRILELFPPGRDGNFGVTSGVWETTGVIPVEGFGGEAWLLNVQAHAPTATPAPGTVEDGQLVLVRRTDFRALGD